MLHSTFSLLVIRAASTRGITTGVCTTRPVSTATPAADGDISDDDDGK